MLKRYEAALAVVLGLAGTVWGDVTLASGDTLDWATQAPAATEEIRASGGTLVFSADATVMNVFHLTGPVNVQIANGAQVRFVRKWLKESDAGKMVFDGSFAFGSDTHDTFAYLPPDSVAFTEVARAAGAKVTLTGYPSFTVMPEKWAEPVDYVLARDVYVTLYGTEMFDVVDGRVRLPLAESGAITWRMSSTANFAAGAMIEVPTNQTFILRRMNFNAATGSGSTVTGDKASCEFSNDLTCVAGGTVRFDSEIETRYWGDITGEGHLRVGAQFRNRYLFGSLAGMTPSSTLTLESGWLGWDGAHSATRLNSSFPESVRLLWSQPTNIVSIGFTTPDGKFDTNSVYRLGALSGVNVDGGGEYGVRLQYNKNMRIEVGTLRGSITAVASTTPNSCDLAIDRMATSDNGEISAKLYIKNGMRLSIGATEGWPEIYYMNDQVSSNSITVADGALISKITIPAGKSVYLFGNCDVGMLLGAGTLVVAGGTVRVGAGEATAKIVARDGAVVTCGGGEDIDALLGEKAALWLDASATECMVGAWNEGWAASTAKGGGAQVLKHCPATTLNGAPTATWTNGFPLVEKWFDKRPAQRLNYGWQDRCVNYTSTLYTLAYPYLVPNGLNGRAYMSFGEHGETDWDADVYGLSCSKDHTTTFPYRERRRMPFMQDMKGDKPEGHALKVGTAILVFGSQNGGGRAILGGYRGENEKEMQKSANGRAGWVDAKTNPTCSANYIRGGAGYGLENSWLSTKDYAFFVDGEQVDPTATSPNGGWQIVSFNGNGLYARSLGMALNFAESGGQNYAEVLIFEKALTTRERRTVEGYLAQKWNLPGGCSVKGPVTAEAGSTVRGHVTNVGGDGTWRLDSPEAAPALDGTFAGDVALTFTYSDGAVSPVRTLNAAPGSTRGAVAVHFAAAPQSGTYPLVRGTAAENFAAWSLTTTGDTAGRVYSLDVIDGALALVVKSGGTMVIFR
ncbi:MAG: hypothetical protein ACI4RA_08405 [Kiritimatiellia bacterium]